MGGRITIGVVVVLMGVLTACSSGGHKTQRTQLILPVTTGLPDLPNAPAPNGSAGVLAGSGTPPLTPIVLCTTGPGDVTISDVRALPAGSSVSVTGFGVRPHDSSGRRSISTEPLAAQGYRTTAPLTVQPCAVGYQSVFPGSRRGTEDLAIAVAIRARQPVSATGFQITYRSASSGTRTLIVTYPVHVCAALAASCTAPH